MMNKSKTWLATALIEAGVTKFPEGANWAAQDKCDRAAVFSGERPTITKGRDMHFCNASRVSQVELPSLNPQWHQTVLSREEFDQFVAETAVRSEPQPEPTTTTPTLDQLLQDWRNADDFAQRKQTEADEAAAMRDERWQAVQARAGEMGVTVGELVRVVSEPEPAKPVLTGNFHNTKLGSPKRYIPGKRWGDEICDECGKRFGEHHDVRCPR